MIVRLVVSQHCRLGWWFENEYSLPENNDLREICPKNNESFYSGGRHGVNLIDSNGDEIRAWLQLVKDTHDIIKEEIDLLLKEIGLSVGGFYDIEKILRNHKPSLLWCWSHSNKDFLPPSVYKGRNHA